MVPGADGAFGRRASGALAGVRAGRDDRIVPKSQGDAYLSRFPGTVTKEAPGGHFDLVATWTEAWRTVQAELRTLLR